MCESRGGRPGLSDPIKPCGFCGCKATLNQTVKIQINSIGYKCKVKGERIRLSVLVNKMLPCDFVPHNSVGYKRKVKGERIRLSVLVNKMLPCDFVPHN